MSKVRHVLGISGGKDSAALAIYLRNKYPLLDIEYYFCETDKELDETYTLLNNLEIYLGKKIIKLKAVPSANEAQFDYYIKLYGGFIPSSNARWCTQRLKLEPFEKFVGNDPVVSYVAIRGDEDREGYISHKKNIQSVFPFRRNIWSEEIISNILNNNNIDFLIKLYSTVTLNNLESVLNIVREPLSFQYHQRRKLNDLLSFSIKDFNEVVFKFLKTTDNPLSFAVDFPLVNNEDVKVRNDIFRILEESGIGVPTYYKKIEFEINGEKGYYSRSRSGCFFCFFQQKIEWIWLYENHPERFKQAMEYEKEGYTWMQDEKLEDIIKPERIKQIKEQQLKRAARESNPKSPFLLDILGDAEGEGCAACFI